MLNYVSVSKYLLKYNYIKIGQTKSTIIYPLYLIKFIKLYL